MATGVTRGIVAGSEGLLRGVNAAANLATVAADGFGSQSLKDASVAELDKTFDTATKAYDYIANKGGAGELAGKAIDTAGKALGGDAKAIGDLTEFAVGLAGGGGAAKQGVSATARGAEAVVEAAARSAKSVATKVEAVLTGERETMGIGAAGAKATRSAEAKSGALEEATQQVTQVRNEVQVTADVGKATSAEMPVTGSQWYEHFSNRYGTENVEWGRLPAHTGGKTSGVLATRGGDIDLISGYSGPSASMSPGTVPGMNNILKAHVEAHAASAMRQLRLDDATLYLNKLPCSWGSGNGCANMLPRMLGEGRSLRVVVPGQMDHVFVGVAP